MLFAPMLLPQPPNISSVSQEDISIVLLWKRYTCLERVYIEKSEVYAQECSVYAESRGVYAEAVPISLGILPSLSDVFQYGYIDAGAPYLFRGACFNAKHVYSANLYKLCGISEYFPVSSILRHQLYEHELYTQSTRIISVRRTHA